LIQRTRELLRDELLKDIKSFFDNELTFFAASLSFYTIFALVPLILIMLSIGSSMPNFADYIDNIKAFIVTNLLPAHSGTISKYLDSFMANSFKSGTVGIIYVLLTSIMFFKNYEYIVSKIFHTQIREFWSALTIYWTIITLVPLGLLLSFYLSSEAQILLDKSHYTSGIKLFNITPFLIVLALFFVIYKISANTKINSKAALISSFISALIWSLMKMLFVYYVLHNKAYTTIYGSFATILFFFLWIYFSWIIIVYGLNLTKVLNDKLNGDGEV